MDNEERFLTRLSASLINQHVKQIEAALSNARTAFFELIMAVKKARDDLGDEFLQNELADRLSISPSTLTKYLKIADCDPIIKKQKTLPPTLTTLYSLVLTHNTLIKVDGEDKADKAFYRVLEKVNVTSEANDVAPHLKKARERLANINKINREKKLLSLSASETQSSIETSSMGSLQKLLDSNKTFRTIFIDPPKSVIDWASKSGIFANDIDEKYHLADLRAPSTKTTVEGFVYCPAHQIDGGLKLLDAAGFEYRDIIVPCFGPDGFEYLRNEKVLIRGERGVPNRKTIEKGIEADLYGALAIAEEIGSEPRLYVFASEVIDGWTCVK